MKHHSLYHELARGLRKCGTLAEKKLWIRLRRRQLMGFKFRRQQPLGRYIVDFCCLERKLIIELDGGQHLENTNADRSRTNDLRRKGFQVLRFWNNMVINETDRVAAEIFRHLNGADGK